MLDNSSPIRVLIYAGKRDFMSVSDLNLFHLC